MVKNQHIVPRFYLRRFSKQTSNKFNNDKKNKLSSYSKTTNTWHESNVYKKGSLEYYYDIEKLGENKQIIENTFSELEASFAVFLNKLIKKLSDTSNINKELILKYEEKLELSLYVAVQMVRVPNYRNLNVFNCKKLIEFIFNMHPSLNPLNFDINEIEIDETHLHGNLLFKNLNVYTEYLSTKHFIFLKNKTNTSFITSDNPVSWLNPNQGLISPNLNIVYPLSNEYCLLIVGDNSPHFKYRNRLLEIEDVNFIKLLNKSIFEVSTEYIYTHPDKKSDLDYLFNIV